MIFGFLLFVLRTTEALEVWTTRVVECCKQSYKGHFSRILGAVRVERSMIVEVQLKRFQRGILSTGLEAIPMVFCQSLAAFCPYLENLPKAKFQNSGLVSLVVEISRQQNITQGHNEKDKRDRNTNEV